ncbi:MAG: ROK family protein [Actinobacteria bacterium]|nr:ROK family protein [Actinomycetota bacterium]
MGACYLAVDVGTSRLAAGVVGEKGEVIVRDRIPTPARDVWPALARLIKRVQASAPTVPLGCGVGCDGPLDSTAGTVSPLYIPSLEGFALASEIGSITGLVTTVANRCTAVARAEMWCGAAVGITDFVAVMIGSGVGGGIISGGHPLEGQHGNAGGFGHMIVESDGRPCPCGGKGCLETYCGGRAIELETGRPPQRAPEGVVERTGIYVGRALASLGALCDLQSAVIGGSVALGFGEPFFTAIRSELEQRAKLSFLRGFTVVPVGLGQLASLVGAAALVRAGK